MGGISGSFAQGTTGGMIGKEEKSVSGTRNPEPEAPSGRSRSRTETRQRPAREATGSASRFDGSWNFIAAGCSAGTVPAHLSGGTVAVRTGSGTISAGGALRGTFTVFGMPTVAIGRLSGTTGAGTYSRSDGCKGRWTAIKL